MLGSRSMKRDFACLAILTSILTACDEPRSTAVVPVISAVAPPSACAKPAEAPAMTVLSMDENALTVNGTRIALEGPELRARVAAEVLGKPKIAGETVTLVVTRKPKVSKVSAVLLGLKDAKASAVVIKGPKRDGTTGEIPIGYGPMSVCTAVAHIGTDVAISVWSAGGGGVKRLAKGMAGPDTTLGSQAFEKSVNACDSSTAVLSADESITWGLIFDLALASKEAANAGFKAQRFIVLSEPAAPGKKVTLPN
jgi:hypothetical protein